MPPERVSARLCVTPQTRDDLRETVKESEKFDDYESLIRAMKDSFDPEGR
jgi:hypothetical protein